MKEALTKPSNFNSYYQNYCKHIEEDATNTYTNANANSIHHHKMTDKKNLVKAFQDVIESIEKERHEIDILAKELDTKTQQIITSTSTSATTTTTTTTTNDNTHYVLHETNQLSQLSQTISTKLQHVFTQEIQYLVPAVATLIPSKEQIRVNNKILRNLGIFESRAILVGMYETLQDDRYGNENERGLFEREIPFVPRKMIPRWKRTLYEEQAGMLP